MNRRLLLWLFAVLCQWAIVSFLLAYNFDASYFEALFDVLHAYLFVLGYWWVALLMIKERKL